MDAQDPLSGLGLVGAAYAAPVRGGPGVGFDEHALVSPASVMKIQVALVVEDLVARGVVDGSSRHVVPRGPRTPGPVGMSLMQDEVTMSVRDLVVAMLTISDNVATDELLAVVGLDEVNRRTRALGMARTLITSDLRHLLDDLARDVGFGGFSELVAHDPEVDGPPSRDELALRIERSGPLDPSRGPRTTAFETVVLLQALWTDQAAAPAACRRVRDTMARQLTRGRIASGFEGAATVAAKSGGLLGVVRNEAGVVTFADGSAYAVAVFTRREPRGAADPAAIDRAIGQCARLLVERLRDR